MGEVWGLCSSPKPNLNFFSSFRFAWGLIPGVPAKSEAGAEPTDIILRYAGNGKSFENGVTALTSEICLYKSIIC